MTTQPPPPPPAASYPPPPPPPAGSYPLPATAPVGAAGPGPLATAGPHLRAVVAGLDQETLKPTLIVTAVIFGIWLVVTVLGAIAPAPQTNGGGSQGGQYITVGNVKFGLAQGWQLVNGPGQGRLTNGVADLDIYVYNFTGQPVDLYNQYNATQGQNSGGFNAGAAAPVALNGLPAVRGSYSGSFQGAGNLDGEVTVVTTGGKGYVFDVYAPGGLLNQSLPQAEQMLATLQLNQ